MQPEWSPTAISVPSGPNRHRLDRLLLCEAEAVGGAGSTLGAMIGVLFVGATGLSTTVATAADAAAAGVAAGPGGTVLRPCVDLDRLLLVGDDLYRSAGRRNPC